LLDVDNHETTQSPSILDEDNPEMSQQPLQPAEYVLPLPTPPPVRSFREKLGRWETGCYGLFPNL